MCEYYYLAEVVMNQWEWIPKVKDSPRWLVWGWEVTAVFNFESVLKSSYGAPLAQIASYLALHNSLFGPVAQLIIIILSLIALTHS